MCKSSKPAVGMELVMQGNIGERLFTHAVSCKLNAFSLCVFFCFMFFSTTFDWFKWWTDFFHNVINTQRCTWCCRGKEEGLQIVTEQKRPCVWTDEWDLLVRKGHKVRAMTFFDNNLSPLGAEFYKHPLLQKEFSWADAETSPTCGCFFFFFF